MQKPIGPTAHVAIDYGFVATQFLAPSLFGLKGAAKSLCYFFGATQGVINALTDNRLGMKRVIPLHVHGELETPFVPALLALPLLAGAMKQPNARKYFLTFFGIATVHYLLTDYEADLHREKRQGRQIQQRTAARTSVPVLGAR
jgi:hypothetical protein